MALTIIIVMAFIAASVNGNFVWQNADNFAGKNFKFHNNLPNFPKFPAFPAFPQFNFPIHNFPTMPPMVILSPEDIAKKSGSNYNGMAVSSLSSSTVDEKGNVIKKGGGFIITNTDGVVKKITFGDPPNVEILSVPIWKPIIPIAPIELVALRTYRPGKNENFIGISSIGFSRSSNMNGAKTSAGGANIISNVNGNVDEKNALFGEKEA